MFWLFVLALAVGAWQALHARSLLHAALWLAGVSALTAIALSTLGALALAVVELSVGAGLVTVLLVFAINLAGTEPAHLGPLFPIWLAGLLVSLALLLLFNFTCTWPTTVAPGAEPPLAQTLWGDRALDVLLQLVMLFTTALTLLGLLAEQRYATAEARKDVAQPKRVAVETRPAETRGGASRPEVGARPAEQ